MSVIALLVEATAEAAEYATPDAVSNAQPTMCEADDVRADADYGTRDTASPSFPINPPNADVEPPSSALFTAFFI